MTTSRDYYAETAPMSDPGDFRDRLVELPDDVPELCNVIQGTLIHYPVTCLSAAAFFDSRSSSRSIKSPSISNSARISRV